MNEGPDLDRTARLLERVRAGEPAARESLFARLYEELRDLAAAKLRGEALGHTLQPTALVHEVYLKVFANEQSIVAEDRGGILATLARAMRQVLVDHARARDSAKRGGGAGREPLDDLVSWYEEGGIELVAISDALEQLEQVDPELTRVVEMRFFSGHSNREVAEALGKSERSIERAWATARAWLQTRLEEAP